MSVFCFDGVVVFEFRAVRAHCAELAPVAAGERLVRDVWPRDARVSARHVRVEHPRLHALGERQLGAVHDPPRVFEGGLEIRRE